MDERRGEGAVAATTDKASAEPSGRVVVFWLFVALSVATAAALLYFAQIAPEPARPRIYSALVGNLALPIIAWYVYKNLKRHKVQ